MKFTISRSGALTTLSQALKTCNVKAKGGADSEFLFRLCDDTYMEVLSINEWAEQTLRLDLMHIDIPSITQGTDGPNCAFSVNGQALVEFLKQFPDSEVACAYHADKGIFAIGSNKRKSQFAFPAGTPEDFVPRKFKATGLEITLNGTAIANVLRLTAFAASTDCAEAPKTAVKVRITGGTLIAQATDSERISMATVVSESIEGESADFLIPRAIAETLGVLLEDVNSVTIIQGERHVRFEWADTTFTSALENETGRGFPDLLPHLNAPEVARVNISRAGLVTALKLASLVAKDSYLGVRISADGFTIRTSDDSRRASYDVVTTQESSGEAETMVICRQFAKAVEMAPSPWIDITFNRLSNQTIGVIVKDENYDHMLFPCTPQLNGTEVDAE